MRPTRHVAFLITVLFANSTTLPAQNHPASSSTLIIAIRFGKLCDGKGKVGTNATVVVDGGKIRTITTTTSDVPQGAETIDLSNYTGLPGFIDVHTHMTMYAEESLGVPMRRQTINASP